MKKAIILTAVLLFSCSVNLNKQNIKDNINVNSQTTIDFNAESKKKEKEIIDKIRNKKDYNSNPIIKINTSLLGKNIDSKVFNISAIKNEFDIKNVPQGNIVFQEIYTMENNKPFEIIKQFRINDTTKRYTLYVKRGNDNDKNDRVTGNININSYDWFKNKDFRCNDEATEESILLNSNNQISIKLQGKKKSIFTVMIIEGGTAGYVRKRDNPLGNHETNAKHLKANDFNIFDPNDLKSVENLEPYNGDKEINGIKISSNRINGKYNSSFQTQYIGIKFRNGDESKLQEILTRYNATVEKKFHEFYILKLDLKKANLQKIGDLISQANKATLNEINEIEFSSLASMQTFTIYLDTIINYHKELETVEINNVLEKQSFNRNLNKYEIPTIKPNDWDIDLLGESNFTLGGVTQRVHNWDKTVTGVSEAWKIATGRGVKAGIIDQGFNLNHPEMTGKYIFEPNDRIKLERSSCTQLEEELEIDSFNFRNEFFHVVRDCGVRNHGHYVAMTGFASKNNVVGSSGVAPDTTVKVYDSGGSITAWEAAYLIENLVGSGSKVINLSYGSSSYFGNIFTFIGDIAVFGSFSGYGSFAIAVGIANALNSSVVVATTEIEVSRSDIENIDISINYFSSIPGVIGVAAAQVKDITNTDINPPINNQALDPMDNNHTLIIDSFPGLTGGSFLSNNTLNNFTNFSNPPNPNIPFRLEVADFSSYGSNLIYAPGDQIYVSSRDNFNVANRELAMFLGTSAATPFVSGVLSLMYEVKPDLTVSQAKNILSISHRYRLGLSQKMRDDVLWNNKPAFLLDAF